MQLYPIWVSRNKPFSASSTQVPGALVPAAAVERTAPSVRHRAVAMGQLLVGEPKSRANRRQRVTL